MMEPNPGFPVIINQQSALSVPSRSALPSFFAISDHAKS
jgi:hypothetical protein